MPEFQPVGRCIYCGATEYLASDPNRVLGDEHIIPLALGGDLILPRASCSACEKITSGIESKCVAALFSSGRPHMPHTRGRSKLKRTKISIKNARTGETQKIDIADHPGSVQGFHFPVARMFSGIAESPQAFTGNVNLTFINPDYSERLKRLESFPLTIGGGILASTFGRLLAKIAHAFAVAKLGYGNFESCLPDVIIGDGPYDDKLSLFVGSAMLAEPRGASHHELDISYRNSAWNQRLLVVRVRLFSDTGLPSHYVVVGLPL